MPPSPWPLGELVRWAPGAEEAACWLPSRAQRPLQIAFIAVVSCCRRGLARAGSSFPVPQLFTLAPLPSSPPCQPRGLEN